MTYASIRILLVVFLLLGSSGYALRVQLPRSRGNDFVCSFELNQSIQNDLKANIQKIDTINLTFIIICR